MIDALLVRAPVGVVYRTLTDLDAWPHWSAGCRCTGPGIGPETGPASDPRAADRRLLVLPRSRRGPGDGVWRIAVTPHGWRHDLGVVWDVSGQVDLVSEWWLEGRAEGTVVHHLVRQARSPEARVIRHHHVMMRAMQAMKDHLELAVALASGRIP